MSEQCMGPHVRPKRPWLCVTSASGGELHQHLCGTHVKAYTANATVRGNVNIRTIDPTHPGEYGWLNGKGCAVRQVEEVDRKERK